MATYIASVPDVQLGTDAGFRSYIQHFIAVLTHGGTSTRITRTSDTGQINESTVTVPGTATTAGGNWSTAPAIFKVEWTDITFYIAFYFGLYKKTAGTTTADLGQFTVWATIAGGTDGASGLINQWSQPFCLGRALYGDVATSRGTKKSYSCERDGFLSVVLEVGMNNSVGFPSTSNSDRTNAIIISKRPGSGKKSLTVLKGGGIEWVSTSTTLINTVTQNFNSTSTSSMYSLSGFVLDRDTPFDRFSQSIHLTSLNNGTGLTSVISGNTWINRHVSSAYCGQWEDPNIVWFYGDDFTYEQTFTITDDLGTRTFISLNPALRCTQPAQMRAAIRWE